MLAKTITYNDLEGNEKTDTFYFNLNKGDLIKMNLYAIDGDDTQGMAEKLQAIIAAKKGREIIDRFEEIIKMAYGVKGADGIQFIKNDAVWEAFYYSDAYSELLSEIVMDAGKASEFINAVLPAKVG